MHFWVHNKPNIILNFFISKIFTHDGRHLSKLREMVGYECLPAEYGGPATNVLDTNLIFNHLSQNAEYLEKLQDYEKL